MSSVFGRLLERYLGLPQAADGQSTNWRLELRPFGEGLLFAAFVALACIAVAYVIAVYRLDAARVSRTKRILLIVLRLSTAAVALLCLLEATLSVGRIGLPVIAVVIDDSASMGLEDRYSSEETNDLADRLVKEGAVASKNRLGLAQAVLTRNDGEFLRRLLKHHALRLYRFSDTAVRLASRDFTSPDEVPEITRRIRELKAEGTRTRPGPAVRRVLDDFRGSPPAAVILFSDGVSSTGDVDRLTPAAEAAAAAFVPIDTVAVGSEQPARDLQIYDVSAEELAFVGDPYTVSAKIKADGFDGRQSVTARLTQRDSSRVLAETAVVLGKENEPVPFELSYVPSEAGEMDVVVEVLPLPDESNRENNREVRHLSVRREKIRVLLADGGPRWEFRYLKTLFERDPSVNLKTVLQEADVEYASEDQTALPHFPLNRDELFSYDVLVLGDLHPALLGTRTAELIRDFVRDSGGGVLLIAGTGFNPAAYRGTPLEDLVPLDLSDVQPVPEETISVDGFRPELTIDGLRGTGIYRLADSESATLEVWKTLPALHWLFGNAPPRPGARVLMHWRAGAAGAAASAARDAPVVALQSVGAGKVLFHATDEFWRWRFRVGDQLLGPFWGRAVRYLSRSRLLGRDRTAELTSDRLVYAQGEPVTLRARFYDERFIPSATETVTVTLEQRNRERRIVSLAKTAGQPTVFEGQIASLPIGTFHAWIASPSFKEAPPSADFRIDAGSDELIKRNVDRREMEQTAQISRGIFSNWDEAVDLPARIPAGHPVPLSSRERIPLWDRWEILVLFAGLLAAEWILRKRSRLL